MATRSTIAIEREDGSVMQIYCHWDGYLEHNGTLLLEYYSDPVKLQQLIDLGNLSSLAPEIGEKHDFRSDDHSVCTFYGRDRGEEDQTARVYKNFKEYAEDHPYEEYEYILRKHNNGHTWFVCHDKRGYRPLEDELAELEQDE